MIISSRMHAHADSPTLSGDKQRVNGADPGLCAHAAASADAKPVKKGAARIEVEVEAVVEAEAEAEPAATAAEVATASPTTAKKAKSPKPPPPPAAPPPRDIKPLETYDARPTIAL